MLDKLRQDPYVRALVALILGFIMLDFLFSILFGKANVAQRYVSLSYIVVQLLAWVIVGCFFYGIYILAREFFPPAVKKLESLLPESPRCSQCKRSMRHTWACCPYCGGVNTVEGSKT